MSLHEMHCNKSRPCYKCIESYSDVMHSFHIGIEYSIDYVERRLKFSTPNYNILLEKHFKLLE